MQTSSKPINPRKEFTIKSSPDFQLGEYIENLPKETRKPINTMKEYKERSAISRAEIHTGGALQ